MADSSIQLSRDEFFLLHFFIVQACDRFLEEEEKKEGLNRINEQYFYGYGPQQYDDPNDESYNRSIKYVVLNRLGTEIKHEKYGFRQDKYKDFQVKFNGRYLGDLKKDFNNGNEEITMAQGYLLAFLKLLDAETIAELKERYLTNYGTSHLSIVEDSITPTPTTRIYSKEDETPDPESTHTKDKALPKKQPHHLMENNFKFKLQVLENTDWHYYRFDYKNEGKPQSIRRMVFRIGKMLENGDLEASLIAGNDTFSDYTGRISSRDSNDKILICRLSTKDVGAKLKVLMFHIDPRIKAKLYLGQYLEYDDDYHIMNGTIVIEKLPSSNFVDLESKVFRYGSKEMNDMVDPTIQDYFEDKYLNFTKTPTGISTHYDFKNWLDKKRSEREKKKPSRIFDLYISVPFVGLKNDLDKLNKLEAIINRMSDSETLKEIGINKSRIHHRTVKNNQNYDPGVLLKKDQKAIQKSKAFLFIFPQETKIVTSVFIQAGYAVHSGFPTFILYKDLNCLPYSLQVSDKLSKVRMKKIETMEDILLFPEWVKVNEYYKLYDYFI